MPLEIYQRGPTWWVRGRVELNGRAVSGYYRQSTGASCEAGARDWCRAEEERAIRRHLLGDEAPGLTFAEAVMLYPAKPAEAKFLINIVQEIGETRLTDVTPEMVRGLGLKIYPDAATDTWQRQVVTPVRAVINYAHDKGKCPPIRIRSYSQKDRVAQDEARGRQSRAERKPGSWQWIDAFSAYASPYLVALAEFMFETGARIGQAIALKPRDLDLQQARIRLPPSKGHPSQWVAISMEMVVRLANLPPRAPVDRRRGTILPKRVFGYAGRNGPLKAWRTACTKAGIDYLPPHSAGRHGFYTELRVRQGVDPITAAKAGRWSDPSLPDRIYAHVEAADSEARVAIRSSRVQTDSGVANKPMKRIRKS